MNGSQPPLLTKQVKIIVALIILAILALSALQINSRSAFRLVDRSPPGSVLPTSTDTIILDFNRQLNTADAQPAGYIQLEPSIPHQVDINDKTLKIILGTRAENDSKLTIELKELQSVNNERLSSSVTYNVKYVPFGELSEEERERQSQTVSRPEDRHPLLTRLPHDEISFRISFVPVSENFGQADDWRSEKDNFVVTISTYVPEPATLPDNAFTEATQKLRQRALDWIRERGVDPDNDINILYLPDDETLQGTDTFSGDGDYSVIEQEVDAPADGLLEKRGNDPGFSEGN